jgi:plasmid stabilization system protein ParE
MTFRVILRARATEDAKRIHRWLAQRTTAGAAAWISAFEETLESLSTSALHHGFAPENRNFPFELRQCFFKTAKGRRYRLLYSVAESEVRILRVRSPGQTSVTKRMIDEGDV